MMRLFCMILSPTLRSGKTFASLEVMPEVKGAGGIRALDFCDFVILIIDDGKFGTNFLSDNLGVIKKEQLNRKHEACQRRTPHSPRSMFESYSF